MNNNFSWQNVNHKTIPVLKIRVSNLYYVFQQGWGGLNKMQTNSKIIHFGFMCILVATFLILQELTLTNEQIEKCFNTTEI